jgi:hypothetical protein
VITAIGGVLAAVVAGIFALAASRDSGPEPTTTTSAAVAGTGSTATTSADTSFTAGTGTTDTAAVDGQPPAAAKIESVQVKVDDIGKVGAGLFQLDGRSSLDFRYWWTTLTDYGEIEGGDKSCTVVMTITNLGKNQVVDRQRSAYCTMEGWYGARLPQGRYRLSVSVTLESGSKGSGSFAFTVIP